MGWVLLWLLCGIAAAAIYYNKGRSWVTALLVGLIFGPIGVILAALTPRDPAALEERQIKGGEWKRCPRCKELVRAHAAVCKHCGQAL
jgi:hypothetical protein